jgi:hypothetical protein
VTEETVLNPDSEGGKQLAIVEGFCRAVVLKLQYCVWGLMAKIEIHSVFSRSRKSRNPDAPINLIHQTDCIGIILRIIEKNLGRNLHATAPTHPSRETYYTQSIGIEFSFPQV